MSNVNLLPQNIKEEIEQSKKNLRARSYLIKTSFMLIILIVGVAGTYFYLSGVEKRLTEQVKSKEKEINQLGAIEGESRLLSERLEVITKIIKNETNYWSGTLEEIKKVMPKGAYLTSVSLSPDNKTRGRITGFAASKNVVAGLRDNMSDSKKFEYVDIESSTRNEDTNTGRVSENFVITFSLTKGGLDE